MTTRLNPLQLQFVRSQAEEHRLRAGNRLGRKGRGTRPMGGQRRSKPKSKPKRALHRNADGTFASKRRIVTAVGVAHFKGRSKGQRGYF